MFATLKNKLTSAKNNIKRRAAVKKRNGKNMNKRSISYELVRIYVRFAFWLTHSRITVSGKKNIPTNVPVIFAPNHQNALMDPLALVCTNKLQTVWLARADIFRSKIARSILSFLKIWPIYRIRDGKENLANNEEIFDKVTQLLEAKQSVALFPEAAHSGRRQMQPHKKAIPRIALETESKNKFDLGLQIVPVGITYSHYWNFNRSLLVQYGEPITLNNFWFDYEMNPQKAMLDLRDLIYEKLCPLVIEISSQKYYSEYEAMRQLAGKAAAKRKFFTKKKALQQFLSEKELIAKLETLENESPRTFSELITQLDGYEYSLKENKLTDAHIENAHEAGKFKTILKIVLAVVTLPVFVLGLAFNAIPFYVPRALVKRKVKDKIFTSSFNYVLGLIIFPVFYLLVYLLVLQPRFSFRIGVPLVFLLPFLGKAAYMLLQFYKNTFQESKYLFWTKDYKAKTEKLIEERWILIETILEKANF